jgi:CBS domain containing-hemolysin-like protein
LVDPILGASLVALCLLVSAGLAGSEAALSALPDAFIRQQQEEGRFSQRGFYLWLERLPRLSTAFQVTRALVHVIAGGLATLLALRGGRPTWYAVVVSSAVALGFAAATAIVRAIGRAQAEKVATLAARIVWAVDRTLLPLTWVVTKVGARFHGRAGAAGAPPARPSVSEEQLEYLIELGREQGVVSEQQEKMLAGVLELPQTSVREVMVPRVAVEALRVGMPMRDVMNKVLTDGHSRYPVYGRNSEDVVGILYTKDLFKAIIERGPLNTRLVELVRKPLYIPESQTIDVALRRLQGQRSHMAIVVDEFGGTAGVVTLEDILEEIVGDIADEHDAPDDAIRRVGDGRYLVDGTVPLRDLGDRLDLEFPEDGEYDTLAGFLVEQAGRVPGAGEEVAWRDLHFKVREADERRVTKVEITLAPPAAATAGGGHAGE